MTLIGFIILLVIAGVAGAVGQAIAGYGRGGLLVSIGFGFIGALVGMFLARALRLPEFLSINAGGMQFPVIWSIIGAALFAALLGLMHRRRPLSHA